MADIDDKAWELGQELADNDTIAVRAVAGSDVRKARVGTSADSCDRVEGDGRIAPVGHRPCRTDVVHCVAEWPAALGTANDDERSSPSKGRQCHPSMRAAPAPGWLSWERNMGNHGGEEKEPSASEAELRSIGGVKTDKKSEM